MIPKPDQPVGIGTLLNSTKSNQEKNLISTLKGLSDEHLLFALKEAEKEISARIDRAQSIIDTLTKRSLLPEKK